MCYGKSIPKRCRRNCRPIRMVYFGNWRNSYYRTNQKHLYHTNNRNHNNLLCKHQQWYLRKHTNTCTSNHHKHAIRSYHNRKLIMRVSGYHTQRSRRSCRTIQMVHRSNRWNSYYRSNKQHIHDTCNFNDHHILCEY